MNVKFLMPFLVLAVVPVFLLASSVVSSSSEPDTQSAHASVSGSSARQTTPHVIHVPTTPRSMDFCAESAPLDRFDVFESLDREIVSNTFFHSNTIFIIKRSARFFPVIEPILKEFGVPDDMKYLCAAESNLLPTSKSPVGAAGLWQFMESTAAEYGLRVNDEVDERYDVEKSTRAACRMLLSNYAQLKSWSLVAAAYNGGMARVRKNMEAQHQSSYYDIRWAEETGRYVFRIMALKTILSAPQDFGFFVEPEDYYAPYDTRIVEVDGSIPDLAQWAVDNGTSLKMVRLLNPWLLKNNIVNARKAVLKIQLPK